MKLNVVHSGNIGDILYSIPFLLGILERKKYTGINFYLRLNTPAQYSNKHPLGNVLLNRAYADALLPLLKHQGYINEAVIYTHQRIDIDLDEFRKLPIYFQTGVIPRWYFWLGDAEYDLSRPWVFASPADNKYKDKVLVSRTHRHRSSIINYKFMNAYAKDIVFVGTEDEWKLFKVECPDCTEWVMFKTVLDMAKAYAACKFFVGNQGMPYTLAESMKINRLLEANAQAPNNIPFSTNGQDALFQGPFEKKFKKMYERV
jgi:hypothetical protein